MSKIAVNVAESKLIILIVNKDFSIKNFVTEPAVTNQVYRTVCQIICV